jgi:hypothetical protein
VASLAWGLETEDASPLPTTPSWFDKAQQHDWASADYDDLKSWARQLGLSDTGTVEDLRSRIGQALGFHSPEKPKEDKILTIESAQQAGFINVDRTDGGKELHLSGGVHLIFVDRTKNVTHDITCAELWYDQSLGEMTAKGDVVYTLINGTSKDVFHGDSLTFRLKDSEGVFYGGSSTRSQTIQGVALTFRYTGKTIRRSGGDAVVMDDGAITSSQDDPPNYQLRASKIWILAPGEWGIQNAVLWIGRVPVFYFPFYFQPGDDFFFNPVLGFPGPSDPRGTYLQTTTYFLGHKVTADNPMSFLQLSGSGSSAERVRRGLFMVQGTPPPQPKDWILKMIADTYSNQGFISALYSEMPGLWNLTTFKWWVDLAFTHPLDSAGNPYTINPFNGIVAPWSQFQWDQGYFGPWQVPFRWGFHLEGASPDYTFKFEFYTDPLLWGQTFSNRSENFSLTTLLGLNTSTNTYTVPIVQSTLNWQLAMTTKSFPLPWTFWNNITINKLEADGEWDEQPNQGVTNPYSSTANLYAPSIFIFPSVAISTGGKFWDSSAPTTPVSAGHGLLPPWSSLSGDAKPTDSQKTSSPATTPSATSPVSSSQVPSASGLIPPALEQPLTLPSTLNGTTGNVAWTWTPSWRNETHLDKTQWVEPGQMNWAVQTQIWFLNQTADVAYSQSSADNFWNLKEDLNLTQAAQDTWVQASGLLPAQILANQQSDAQNSQIQVYQTFSPSLNPLISIPQLAGSTISYTLKSRIWTHTYSAWDSVNNVPVFQDGYWDGTPASVPQNNASASLNWSVFYPDPVVSSVWTWSDDLKPLPTNQSFSWALSLTKSWGSLTSNFAYRDQGNGWEPDPWVSNLTWTPLTGLSLSQNYTYDLVNKEPQTAITTLSAWGFTTRYTAQQTIPYTFDKTTLNWDTGTTPEFLNSELDFSWNTTWNSPRFWKGRAFAGFGLNSSWNINLQQYTQMPLTVGYTVNLSVSRFLDLTLSHNFTNNQMYMYFPGIVQSFGIPTLQPRNFWQDTLNSLAFWDQNALKQGAFKASSITLGLTHYMDDWQVQLNYTAMPQIPTGTSNYQWVSTLTLLIQWYPFPQLKANVQQDQNNNWSTQNPQTYTGN